MFKNKFFVRLSKSFFELKFSLTTKDILDQTHLFSLKFMIELFYKNSWRLLTVNYNSSVIRQKGKSQNGCFKKTKHAKFSEKRTFLTPWYAHQSLFLNKDAGLRPATLCKKRLWCAYQGIRNVRFSENLACFFFMKHPFWDSPFCLITDEL